MSELIIGGLDQPLISEVEHIMQMVDDGITQSINTRNVFVAFNMCRDLIGAAKLSGIALAKALYLLHENWDAFGTEQDFEEAVFMYLGIHKHTLERYIKVWKLYALRIIPPSLQGDFMQRNIKDQIPIANAVAQGFEITDEHWKALARAPDYNTVSRIIREEVKGAPPRSRGLHLEIDDIGSIWAWKDGAKFFVGSLEINSDNEVVQHAVERIIGCASIMRR